MSVAYEKLIANPAVAKRRELYLPIVKKEAARVGVDWRYLDALIVRESAYKPDAVGDNGKAVGLGQMHPATAKGLGLDPAKRMDPALAISAAADYFAQGFKKAKGDAGLAGLGYNAGHGRIKPNTTMRGTDDYRGYFEGVQRSIGGKAPTMTAPSMPDIVAAAPAPAPAPSNIEQVFEQYQSAPVPAYAEQIAAIQNQVEEDPQWELDAQTAALDSEAQRERSDAVSNFFGEVPVPQLQLPKSIDDSINEYLAKLS